MPGTFWTGWRRTTTLADWRCLTPAEESMVRKLGHDPGQMVVNRLGEGHWQFLDMKTRMELMVSPGPGGRLRGTVWQPEVAKRREVRP